MTLNTLCVKLSYELHVICMQGNLVNEQSNLNINIKLNYEFIVELNGQEKTCHKPQFCNAACLSFA